MAILLARAGTASHREIGDALHRSINTVEAYNKRLYRKLGVVTRPDAVSTARRFGLI